MGHDPHWRPTSLKRDLVEALVPELTVDNEWFWANFVRQPDGRLLGHVTHRKWTPTAKREFKKLLDSFDEPVYGAVQTTNQLKYLLNLGCELTGDILECNYPGKEGTVMGQVVYIKQGVGNYWLQAYQEEKSFLLPTEAFDGFGKIEEFEKRLALLPSAEWHTNHYFSDGVYTRETFINKGTLLTGYRHKKSTVCIVPQGALSIVVVDELGYAEDKGTILGGTTFVTKARTKKAIYAHEDSIIMNSFPLVGLPKKYHNEDSIEKIEDFIFEKEQ